MKPELELKELWAEGKKRDLTLNKAAELLKIKGWGNWGTNTIKSAVDGTGGELREIVLRIVLKEFLGIADSVNDGPAESAHPGIAKLQDRGDGINLEEWKRRAIIAEDRLKQIARIASETVANPTRATYRPVKVSSKPSAEEEAILDALEKPDGAGGASKS